MSNQYLSFTHSDLIYILQSSRHDPRDLQDRLLGNGNEKDPKPLVDIKIRTQEREKGRSFGQLIVRI